MITGKYPSLRLRRSRKSSWSRRLIEENNLSPNDFILPIFLVDGKNKKVPIKSMPGVYRYTLDKLSFIVEKAIQNGLHGVFFFGSTGQSQLISTNEKKELISKIANHKLRKQVDAGNVLPFQSLRLLYLCRFYDLKALSSHLLLHLHKHSDILQTMTCYLA